MVRAQIDALSKKARQAQIELDSVAMERDALGKERDAAKAALAKARTSSSYSILPHKGPNGTWRRPLIIECRNGTVSIQPNGSTFTLLELARSGGGIRSSPFIMAVAREVIRIGALSTPDGAPSVPYIFFVIRPDGIRPYYEARGRLEMLGIAFGYELVDQEWEIDFSEPDEPLNVDSLAGGRSSHPGPGGGRGRRRARRGLVKVRGRAVPNKAIPWIRSSGPFVPRVYPNGSAERRNGCPAQAGPPIRTREEVESAGWSGWRSGARPIHASRQWKLRVMQVREAPPATPARASTAGSPQPERAEWPTEEEAESRSALPALPNPAVRRTSSTNRFQ